MIKSLIKPASPKALAILLGGYVIFAGLLSIAPVDRTTWFVENATVVIIVGLIAYFYYRGFKLSLMAYLLMYVLIILHTIGGHYTFALVPFGWVTQTFGFARDNFDRVAHFTVGFYAFALAEVLIVGGKVKSRAVILGFPLATIMAVAAAYEIFEWQYAIAFGGAQAANYLGSQGDIWDAQGDMLADTLGAVLAVILVAIFRKKELDAVEK